jgi:cerevisin
MKLFTLTGLSLFFGFAQAKNYILTPRSHHVHTFNYDSFAKEHNLEVLVKINDLVVYKTHPINYNLFTDTFEELFEIEEDQTFTLPKPIVGELPKESLFYVQKPGEQDFEMKSSMPWHLDRVVKHDLPLDNTFEYNSPGSCHKNKDATIHTYIVDTGIDVAHPEFEGRATWVANFAGDDQDTDCNSHGTHCAGLVGSKSYGVCKDAQLFAVKVLNCEGSGSYSGILNGLEFVHKRHQEQLKKNSNVKSIMSMSLGGGFSRAINKAVEALVKSDSMYVVVAAGNEDSDACRTSPASARGILTIMASDKYDNRAYFSNYGTCADLYSPGVDILSTIPNGKTAVYSGTSMATPNLVGVLNHYLDQFPSLNMQGVKDKMMQDASKNKLTGNPKQTNNLLVYLHRD